MDCEQVDTLAIDLLYEELDTRTTHELQQHILGCHRCQTLMERLRGGLSVARSLQLAQPSTLLRQRILTSAAQEKEQKSPWGKQVVRFLALAGSYAMRPQVAMAAVLLIMVGFGAIMLRSRTTNQSRQTRVTEEGIPIADLEKENKEGSPGKLIPPLLPIHSQSEQSGNKNDYKSGDNGTFAESAKEKAGDPTVPEIKTEPAEGKPSPTKLAKGPLEHERYPKKSYENKNDNMDEEASGKSPRGRSEMPKDFASVTIGNVAAAPPAPAGMNADKTLSKGNQAPLVALSLSETRSLRQRSGCAQALRHYQSIANNKQGSSEGANAALEGALCAKQTGQLSTAQTLLNNAARHPETKNKADQELSRLRLVEAQKSRASAKPTSQTRAARPSAADAYAN